MAAGAVQFMYSLPDEEDHGGGGGGGGAEEDHGAGAGGGGAPPPDRRACAVGAMFKVPHEVYLLPARHQGGYVAGKALCSAQGAVYMVGRGVVARAGTDLAPLAHFIDRDRHPGLAEALGDAVSSRDKENAAGQKTARFEPDAKDLRPRRQNARECQFDNAMMGAYVDAVSLNWELRNQLERQRRASAGLCVQLLQELRTEREHSARIAANAAEQMLAAHWQMEDDAGQLADPEAPQQMPLLQPSVPVPQPLLLPPLPAVPAAQMPPAALPGHRLVERRLVIDTGHWPIEVRPRAHRHSRTLRP